MSHPLWQDAALMNPHLTEIAYILDRSGSMQNMREAAVAAFNNFVKTQLDVPGDARLTPAYRLPARYVIHAVGPVWRGGDSREAELLASCYRRLVELAAAHEISSLAIPSISTGIYGYPIAEAAAIAVRTVRARVPAAPRLHEVLFCCFSPGDLSIYRSLLAEGSA